MKYCSIMLYCDRTCIVRFSALIALMVAHGLWAQVANEQPYSILGLGNVVQRANASVYYSGNLRASWQHPALLNVDNPASLASLQWTAFESGGQFEMARLKEGDSTAVVRLGSAQRLDLAFPMRNFIQELFRKREARFHWGMGFSLIPYTTVQYSVSSTTLYRDSFEVEQRLKGKGGSYQLLWTNAVKVGDWSGGLSVGKIFGHISKEREILPPLRLNPNQAFFDDQLDFTSWYVRVGLQYRRLLSAEDIPSARKRYVTAGLYFTPSLAMRAQLERLYWTRRPVFGSGNAIRDTLLYQSSILRIGRSPMEWGLGVSYWRSEQWGWGLDFKIEDWTAVDASVLIEGAGVRYGRGWAFSVGGFYIPELGAIALLRRVHYRAGFVYQVEPRLLGEEHVRKWELPLGITLPVYHLRQISHIHFGMVIGQMWVPQSLMKSYMQFSLGVTFNDNTWFRKRKFF